VSQYLPQPGDIGLTQIHGRVGALIRFGQWLNGDGFRDYEHAFVLVVGESEISSGSVIEAEPGGALLSPLSRYAADTVIWIPCPPGLGAAVAEAAVKYGPPGNGRPPTGVPYSFLDYLAIAAHRIRLPLPGLKRYVTSTRHMICSQLADQAAADGGWHLFSDNRWPGYVTPEDLARLVP
jgi:hypothetical protein